MPQYKIFNFGWIPDIDNKLGDLAKMAIAENWSYRNTEDSRPRPILYSYFINTFERLHEQSKVKMEGYLACFNTGLVTPNQEEIFALFEKNRLINRQPWYFRQFCSESDRLLVHFAQLPEIATYFDDPSDLLYDPRVDLRPRYDHIIDDNQEHFPEPYNDLTNTDIKHQLRNALQGAIDQAKHRIQRNYQTAVPQFYQSRLQLLIPLCLTSQSRADLALVVEKTENSYTAATCLALDWAYNNARLIARPDNEWLMP